MLLKPPFKKLFLVSVYTSPVIGTLIITPVFLLHKYILALYIEVVLALTFFIFLISLINILLMFLSNKRKIFKKYRLLASYSLCIVFIPFFQTIFSPFVNSLGPNQTFHLYLIIFFSVNTVIIIIRDLILIREKNAAIEIENAQLKMRNIEAVNERLKQQIHPHFLFNSLSTLKALITNSPENAEEYLVKLSDFLRYSISSNALNAVKVSRELRSCTDYLEMQKIRFGSALQFIIDVPEEIGESFWIPVFSLQVLVENAIKHTAFTIEAPLYISIQFKGGCIIVSNNMRPKNNTESSVGIGLFNLNERYKILSGDSISISNSGSQFLVSIKLFDNENCNNRG